MATDGKRSLMRFITASIHDGMDARIAERYRIIRALLADVYDGDLDIWRTLKEEDVEIAMMDKVDEVCGDMYE